MDLNKILCAPVTLSNPIQLRRSNSHSHSTSHSSTPRSLPLSPLSLRILPLTPLSNLSNTQPPMEPITPPAPALHLPDLSTPSPSIARLTTAFPNMSVASSRAHSPMHDLTNIPISPMSISTNAISKKRKKKCAVCAKEFCSNAHLLIHVDTTHYGIKKHRCNRCNESFGQSGTLRRHIKAVHLKIKPFKCTFPDCGRMFASNWSRRVHERGVHQGIKPFSCRFIGCDKRFGNLYNTKKHESNVHGMQHSPLSPSNMHHNAPLQPQSPEPLMKVSTPCSETASQ